MKILNPANGLTGIRILCSGALLFCPALSASFYLLYAIAGVTDMLDGAVARKTGTVCAFGAKFDTVADFIFVAVCFIKLLPILDIPLWILIWIGIIAVIKGINLVSGLIVQGKFVSVHSVMNRITGVLLFVLPLSLTIVDLRYSAAIVCAVATFAAIQEGHFIRTEHPAGDVYED